LIHLHSVGVLDAAAGDTMLSQIQSELDHHQTDFHLDFTAVTSIDEPGIKRLLHARELIRAVNGQLRLSSMNSTVRFFFEFRGLDMIFEISPPIEQT
jgi:anti-anti-sigma factor